MLRTADFNDGTLTASPSTAASGRCRRARCRSPPASLGKDAAAVFYLDEYLPVYYEISARSGAEADRRLEGERLRHLRLLLADRLQVRRHRAGLNKAVLGHCAPGRLVIRPAGGLTRHLKVGPYLHPQGLLKGLFFSAPFSTCGAPSPRLAARFIDGEPFGLNRASWASARTTRAARSTTWPCRRCRPQSTFENTEDFGDGVADRFTATAGSWATTGGPLHRQPAAAAPGRSRASGLPVALGGDTYVDYEDDPAAGRRLGRPDLRLLRTTTSST